jgi:hypothetical protein
MGKIVEAAFGKQLAERLQRFVKNVQADSSRAARATGERLADFEMDLALLAMIQVATMRILARKGIMGEDELVPELKVVDRMDGVEDGGLAIDAFREIIEIPRANRLPQPVLRSPTRRARPAEAPAKAKAPAKAASKSKSKPNVKARPKAKAKKR